LCVQGQALSDDGQPSVTELIETNKLTLRIHRIEPLAACASGLQSYCEVLLGVWDTSGKLCPPGRVIDTAERRGEILALDRWVIRETFTWMAADRARLKPAAAYAINLSGLSLSEEQVLPYVMNLLTELRVPPGKVFFEVTETAAIDKLSVAQHFIHTLKGIG